MNKENRQIQKDIDLLRRINSNVFNVEHRVFLETEAKLKEIIKWARTPKEKRKSAVFNWTASPQRQIGYLIESLEFQIDKLKEEIKSKPYKKAKRGLKRLRKVM